MHKYSEKLSNLPEEEQKVIFKKIKSSVVEIVENDSCKTVIVPQTTTTYNKDMRSPTFEKTVLDFIAEQKKFNENQLKFNENQLKFNDEQRQFNKNQLKFNEKQLKFNDEQRQFNKMIISCPTIKKELKLIKAKKKSE